MKLTPENEKKLEDIRVKSYMEKAEELAKSEGKELADFHHKERNRTFLQKLIGIYPK